MAKMMYVMRPVPPAKNKRRNTTRQIHAGTGVCSPNPAQTPANFESTCDFLMAFNLAPIPAAPAVLTVEASNTRKIIASKMTMLTSKISVLFMIFLGVNQQSWPAPAQSSIETVDNVRCSKSLLP